VPAARCGVGLLGEEVQNLKEALLALKINALE
jgi:hypothetical protein